jgi:hypothetical protein
MEQEKE